MKRLLLAVVLVCAATSAWADITDHKTLRRVLEWSFPGSMLEMTEAWDGVEAKQTFLDRAVRWSGAPVTAAQIEAKEGDYLNWVANLPDRKKDRSADDLLASDDALLKILRAVVLAINDGSIVPGSNMSAAQLKAAIKAKM